MRILAPIFVILTLLASSVVAAQEYKVPCNKGAYLTYKVELDGSAALEQARCSDFSDDMSITLQGSRAAIEAFYRRQVGETPAPSFVAKQLPTQLLASRFKGTDVVGPDNMKIGDVSDMLFDRSGKLEAIIISVGGFLGIGAKDVAVVPTSFEFVTNKDVLKLRTSLTTEQLRKLPYFEPNRSRM